MTDSGWSIYYVSRRSNISILNNSHKITFFSQLCFSCNPLVPVWCVHLVEYYCYYYNYYYYYYYYFGSNILEPVGVPPIYLSTQSLTIRSSVLCVLFEHSIALANVYLVFCCCRRFCKNGWHRLHYLCVPRNQTTENLSFLIILAQLFCSLSILYDACKKMPLKFRSNRFQIHPFFFCFFLQVSTAL